MSGWAANCPAAAPASLPSRNSSSGCARSDLPPTSSASPSPRARSSMRDGRLTRRGRMPAGAHRLGARLSAAARRLSARALSSRARVGGIHAAPAQSIGAFFRWRKHRGRSAGRRRRHPLDRAPAGAAGCDAALCRLQRLAGADRGKRLSARTCIATCSSSCRSACRRASSSSAIRWRGRTTICARATAATTWSGTGRRTRRRSCHGCSPTRAA